jgi:1-phosphatidylinositol-4-phosphate 5-kinase
MDEERKEKKRKEQKEYDTRNNVARKKKEVKKKIIRTPDESFKILLNMIMGIQISVQSCPNFKINKDADISNYLNNMIHSIQSINFGKKQEEIFFLNEFAGIIFNNIRLIFGIDKESFISSISPQEFVTEIMISSQTIFEELCSTGKSGSLFYYTRDGRFIVKTISKKEYKFLKKILTKYYSHLKDNPLSLLPKFLGCYKLIRKVKKNKYNIYFIVMMNVFATANHIDKRYDLKGSKIGRQVLKGTIEDKKILNQGDLALKDLDFENRKEKVFIGKKKI